MSKDVFQIKMDTIIGCLEMIAINSSESTAKMKKTIMPLFVSLMNVGAKNGLAFNLSECEIK